MRKNYSQSRAMLAIAKASLRAILRSPSAVIFSIAFPLIFILVFGFLSNGDHQALKIAFDEQSDTTNVLYHALKEGSGLSIVSGNTESIKEDLEKGRIIALVNIIESNVSNAKFSVELKSTEAVNPKNLETVRSLIDGVIKSIDRTIYADNPTIATISSQVEKVPGRIYRTIDFILPGQLGFSLLSSGVFGVAFIFLSLRQTLVLKRFFATPLNRKYIILGEGIARVCFQMTTAIIILLVGHFFFGFTLVHGWVTFLELLLLSLIGLFVFMGLGFIVSGLAKNEAAVPPIANIVTLPQFLLAGTFFPIETFPGWLQPFCRVLPLTHLNDAMRNVAFEGAHLTDCGMQLGILGIWTVIAYGVAFKVFRWE
ncbi:MAG TPA: ABC transporter permease [Parasegetibacter sp.]